MSWNDNCCCGGGGEPATIPTETVSFTEVLRTTINIGANGNINTGGGIRQITSTIPALNEIGANVPASGEFTLPAGSYEIYVSLNLDMEGGQPRTNFNLFLRQGTTVLEEAKGHNYMRNRNDHDQASQSTTFFLETSGGVYNLATQRESSNGVTLLTDGWIIIRRYEQKTATTLTTP